MLNFGVAIIYFINASDGTHKLVSMALLVTFHAIGFIACSKEPLFVELFQIKAQKCLHAWRNRGFHGANSYDAFL
jgi:type IV secretion system protein VirB3